MVVSLHAGIPRAESAVMSPLPIGLGCKWLCDHIATPNCRGCYIRSCVCKSVFTAVHVSLGTVFESWLCLGATYMYISVLVGLISLSITGLHIAARHYWNASGQITETGKLRMSASKQQTANIRFCCFLCLFLSEILCKFDRHLCTLSNLKVYV